MVNIIKGGTNISPLLSAIVLSVLRLTAQKKILIKDTSYNTIVKLPHDKVNVALKLAIEFLDVNKFIDARIENQIILDD